MDSPDIRWKQRFDNFTRVVELLREVDTRPLADFSELEEQGIIKRFEMAFELGWKLLNDYLAYLGTEVVPAGPRSVIKAAFGAGLIDDGEAWIQMMLLRNALVHLYDEALADEALAAIATSAYPLLERMRREFALRVDAA